MNRELRAKGIIIAIGVIICLYLVYPTLRWGTYTNEQRTELAGDISQILSANGKRKKCSWQIMMSLDILC